MFEDRVVVGRVIELLLDRVVDLEFGRVVVARLRVEGLELDRVLARLRVVAFKTLRLIKLLEFPYLDLDLPPLI